VGKASTPEAIETASLDELRALQLDRLKASLCRAFDLVPPMRAKLDAAGVAPDDLTSLDDLARFPFTVKDDLREAYPFGLFAVPMERIVRIHASSGTTGRPTVVGYTQGDVDTWTELMARSIRAAGGGPGDIVHNAYGYGLFTGGLGFHYGAERLGAAVVPVSGGATERQVRLIADFRPTIIGATPSYLLTIADEFVRQGLDPQASSLRLAICGAEPWSDAMREEIETRLDLTALNHYGLSEMMGPGVAQERIDARCALTLWEDHFFPEIVDPVTGAVLPDGEMGELVLTPLTREAMPLIRYRTRDLTRLLPGEGSAMRRIERVKGRSDDMLIIRGVNVFPSQIEAVLAAEPRLAPYYVLEVTRPHRLDELSVHVETRREDASLGEDDRLALEREAEHLIKVHVGVTCAVRVVPPGTIERSEGKAKRVIDRRPKE
jgi:phenylacetate-CoA ligase